MNDCRNQTFVLLLSLVLLTASGCTQSFDPFQENDQYHFSIFGFLDASADTQWVRVMPVREEFFLDPDRPLDATVTLEHVESGESAGMNDSLIGYAHGVYAYNFWTTMELKPEQTYRLTAKRTDAQANRYSYVEVTLPADFPVPLIQVSTSPFGEADIVFVEGVERLADVQIVYHGRDAAGKVWIRGVPHIQDTSRTVSNNYQVLIDPREDSRELVSFPPVFKKQVFVAAADSGFTDFGPISDKIASLPEGVSNIENGTGYLAGIVSKTIPYRSCLREGTIDPIPCELEPYPWSLNISVWNINQ